MLDVNDTTHRISNSNLDFSQSIVVKAKIKHPQVTKPITGTTVSEIIQPAYEEEVEIELPLVERYMI